MSQFEGFTKEYQKWLDIEIKSVEAAILMGNVDYLEHKLLVGKRQGLYMALERHHEMLSYMENK